MKYIEPLAELKIIFKRASVSIKLPKEGLKVKNGKNLSNVDLTNSVYLPRDDICKRRWTHTRQINLVGLNRRPGWVMVVA